VNIVIRCLDISISFTVLVVISPILLYAILTQNSKQMLFIQLRVGRAQKHFHMFKFRTMRLETPNLPTHEINESLITPIGHFLRRTKFDELPQFWNVLKGEMSIVGYRPCLPSQSQLIQMRQDAGIFIDPPGITGRAQISGCDMSDLVKLIDIECGQVKNLCVPEYVKIIFITVLKCIIK
jgi:O-antigen biosynthesis protein WbqP